MIGKLAYDCGIEAAQGDFCGSFQLGQSNWCSSKLHMFVSTLRHFIYLTISLMASDCFIFRFDKAQGKTSISEVAGDPTPYEAALPVPSIMRIENFPNGQ